MAPVTGPVQVVAVVVGPRCAWGVCVAWGCEGGANSGFTIIQQRAVCSGTDWQELVQACFGRARCAAALVLRLPPAWCPARARPFGIPSLGQGRRGGLGTPASSACSVAHVMSSAESIRGLGHARQWPERGLLRRLRAVQTTGEQGRGGGQGGRVEPYRGVDWGGPCHCRHQPSHAPCHKALGQPMGHTDG